MISKENLEHGCYRIDCVGIFIGYALALSVIMTSKAEARLLRNENKKVSDEINSLRNIAVDEGVYEDDDEEE